MPSKSTFALLLAVWVLTILAAGTLRAGDQFAVGAVGQAAGLRDLDAHELERLELRRAVAQSLTLPELVRAPLDVPLQLDGQAVIARLRPRSIRAPGFEVLVQDMHGRWQAHTPPPITTVVGELLGQPGSQITGTLRQGRLQALIRPAGADAGALWVVQPLTAAPGQTAGAVTPGASVGSAVQHAVFRDVDVLDPAGICATDTSVQFSSLAGPPAGAQASGDVVCEIACDADAEFFEQNGSSVAETVADIEAIIHACEAIYAEQFGVHYTITAVRIHGAPAGPYTSSNHSLLLDEFQDEWNAHEVGTPRDVAHLFTGKNIDGSVIGVAYVGVICNSYFGYGLSQSRFSNNFASRVALTAHEVGHNWSASHCNGDVDCGIMCSGLGGCAGILDAFGVSAQASINQKVAVSGCLSSLPAAPMTITAASPAFGRADGGDLIVLSGSAFGNSLQTSVRFGGVAGEVVSVDDDTIVVAAPPGTPGMLVDIEVSGPGGAALLSDGFTFEWFISLGDNAISGLAPGDVDRAFFLAAAGSKLTASLSRKPLESGSLVPGLRLVGPTGEPLAVSEDDPFDPDGSAKFTFGPLTATGLYRLELYGVDGSTGMFKLKTKLKTVGKPKLTAAIGPSTPITMLSFDALPGAEIFKLKSSALAPVGAYEFVEQLPSDLAPELVSIVGPDGPVDLSGLALGAPGDPKLVLKHLALDQLGAYVITLTGAGGSVGWAKTVVILAPPPHDNVLHKANASLE